MYIIHVVWLDIKHLREMHIMNDLGHAYPTGQQDLNNDYFGSRNRRVIFLTHTHACRDKITPAQKFGQNHTASPDAPVAAVSFHKAREHLFIIPPKHSAAALRRRPFRCAFERYRLANGERRGPEWGLSRGQRAATGNSQHSSASEQHSRLWCSIHAKCAYGLKRVSIFVSAHRRIHIYGCCYIYIQTVGPISNIILF